CVCGKECRYRRNTHGSIKDWKCDFQLVVWISMIVNSLHLSLSISLSISLSLSLSVCYSLSRASHTLYPPPSLAPASRTDLLSLVPKLFSIIWCLHSHDMTPPSIAIK